MAREKGTFSYSANYEVKMQAALDPRMTVDTKTELINKETWPYDGDTIYMKEGMCVDVKEERCSYMLVDLSKILNTDYSGWYRMNDYVDEAIQTAITDALTTEV